MHSKLEWLHVHSKNLGVTTCPLQNIWSGHAATPIWSKYLECTCVYSNKFGVDHRCTPNFYFIPIWLECTVVHSNFNGVHTWTTPKYGCTPRMHHHFQNLWSDSATLAYILSLPCHVSSKHNQGTLSIPHLIYIHIAINKLHQTNSAYLIFTWICRLSVHQQKMVS